MTSGAGKKGGLHAVCEPVGVSEFYSGSDGDLWAPWQRVVVGRATDSGNRELVVGSVDWGLGALKAVGFEGL